MKPRTILAGNVRVGDAVRCRRWVRFRTVTAVSTMYGGWTRIICTGVAPITLHVLDTVEKR